MKNYTVRGKYAEDTKEFYNLRVARAYAIELLRVGEFKSLKNRNGILLPL